MKNIRWILALWKPHMWLLPVLFLLTILSASAAMGFPLVIGWILDQLKPLLAAEEPTMDPVITLVWVLIGFGVLRSISWLYPATRALGNCKIEMDVRENYFGIILKKGFRFFNKFRTGDLVTRLTRDVGDHPKIAWFACSGIFRAVESIGKLIFILTAMLIINWKLALLSVVPLPLMIWLFYVVRIQLAKRSRAVQDAISETNDALESCFSGVRILKAYNAQEEQAKHFRKLLDGRIDKEVGLMVLRFLLWSCFALINTVGHVIVIIFGAHYVLNETMSIGNYYTFYMYIGYLLHPLLDIPNLFATSKQAFVCVDRLEEMKNSEGGTEGKFDGDLPVDHLDSIELKNVRFRYDDETSWVLDGIDLRLDAGTRAAVVGPVGCGKSTLVKLVAGMLPAAEGEVLVNSKHIEEYSISDYRSLTGYIPQEPILFSESIKDNVIFGRDISEAQMIDSLIHAQVYDEVEAFPEGFEQMLGQRGLTVSGGQKQRIAIARALAGNPALLLMDDCTASLDAKNEEGFWEIFRRKYPNAACLIVTHRIATARRADIIYFLDEGKIVGKGTHAELLETCSGYRDFQIRAELKSHLVSRKQRHPKS